MLNLFQNLIPKISNMPGMVSYLEFVLVARMSSFTFIVIFPGICHCRT